MEAKTIYAATSITKEVAESPYEGDELARTCTMSDSVNITSDSLAGLIEKLRRAYALGLDDLFIPDDDGPVSYFDFDRYEDVEGYEIPEHSHDAWEAGRIKVWHATYSFTIEKRCALPISPDEFKAAGIKTH